MRAVTIPRFGDADVLTLTDVPFHVRDQLPLTDVAEAHRRIESGRGTGKLVLAVSPPPIASATHGRD